MILKNVSIMSFTEVYQRMESLEKENESIYKELIYVLQKIRELDSKKNKKKEKGN